MSIICKNRHRCAKKRVIAGYLVGEMTMGKRFQMLAVQLKITDSGDDGSYDPFCKPSAKASNNESILSKMMLS